MDRSDKSELAQLLGSWDDDVQDARHPAVGPSDAGRCTRQVAYRVRGEQPDTERSSEQAIMGTLIHEGIARVIALSFDTADRTAELQVQVPGLKRPGTADDVWWAHGLLTDYKTTSGRAFDWWLNRGPDDDAWGQLYAYAYGINDTYGPTADVIDSLRLVAINRDNGASAEWVIPYDAEAAEQAVAQLVTLQELIDQGHELPRQGAGPGRGFPCDYCSWVRTCWNIDDVPEGRSPQSATLDADELEQVAAVAAEYVDAQQIEAKAKRLKEDARAFLVGISVDDAHGFAVRWSGGRRELKPDPAALLAAAEAAGMHVPMTEVVSGKKISVKRTRPAT